MIIDLNGNGLSLAAWAVASISSEFRKLPNRLEFPARFHRFWYQTKGKTVNRPFHPSLRWYIIRSGSLLWWLPAGKMEGHQRQRHQPIFQIFPLLHDWSLQLNSWNSSNSPLLLDYTQFKLLLAAFLSFFNDANIQCSLDSMIYYITYSMTSVLLLIQLVSMNNVFEINIDYQYS